MTSDLRLAIRSLAKSPGFTVVALLTLALGIGANTSMFSMLRTFALRTLPYPEENRLFSVHRIGPQGQTWPHSVANYLDLHAQQNVFERMAAFNSASFALSLPGEPAEQIRGLIVTADFFPLLNVAPALGRVFTTEEERPGQDRVIVLSHRFWRTRLDGQPDVIGRELRIGGEAVTVIGVMPPSFEDPVLWGPTDAWRPMTFSDAARANRRSNYLRVIGRLKPTLSPPQAEAGLKTAWAQLAAAHDINAKTNLRLAPLNQGSQIDDGQISWFILALAALVLLIACANLANLQFARTAARAREHAIRTALGATRGRLMRGVFAESILLSLAGGALGILVALWTNDLLGRRIRINTLQGVEFPLDLGVLAFAFLVSATAGLLFGLLPAWLAGRTDVNDALQQGGRGLSASRAQNRVRHGLIVFEVALALVLLAAASLFIGGLQRLRTRDPGWRVPGLLTASLSVQAPAALSSEASAAYRLAFVQQLEEKIAALPGVERVAAGTSVPTYGFNSTSSFLIEGQPAPAPGAIPTAAYVRVTPGYFATLGLPLVAGRAFTVDDRADTHSVMIINEKMARAFFPGESPLGKRLRHPDDSAWREIVGVVGDARPASTLGLPDAGYQMYRPLAQHPSPSLELVLRAQAAPETLASVVRRIVANLNPDQPIESPDLLPGELERAMNNIRLAGWTLAAFAALGLLLAGLGIYAVIANSVVHRTNEIGVRIALGAQVSDILNLVVRQGLRLALLGSIIGLAGAFGVARVLRSAAPALAEVDLPALVGLVALIVGVATLACYLPARRAARINPILALRAE